MNSEELRHELEITLLAIDTQILVISNDAMRADHIVYNLRHPDGTYVLAPLLTAKASILAALVSLGPSDTCKHGVWKGERCFECER